MRLSQKFPIILIGPLLYAVLAGQTINVIETSSWKSIGSLPVAKSGEFRQSGMMMTTCPLMTLSKQHPDLAFTSYVDPADSNHTMLVMAPKSDESDLKWALTTTSTGSETAHVELRVAEQSPADLPEDLWKLLKHCEGM